MTGALIRFGGAPGNMAVIGDKHSGQATLANVWGKMSRWSQLTAVTLARITPSHSVMKVCQLMPVPP